MTSCTRIAFKSFYLLPANRYLNTDICGDVTCTLSIANRARKPMRLDVVRWAAKVKVFLYSCIGSVFMIVRSACGDVFATDVGV